MSTEETDGTLNPDGVTPQESAPEAGAERSTESAPTEATDSAEATEPSAGATESDAEQDEITDPLTEAMNTIASLEEKLARANADYYNLSQEYNAYVRRSKQEGVARKQEGQAGVIDALLPVLDDIELARQHGDLQGPTGQIAEKLESTLATNFQVERFGAVGDEFDPQLHEALMHQTSAEASKEEVSALIQPGYRQGDKLLRPARVGVVSPE